MTVIDDKMTNQYPIVEEATTLLFVNFTTEAPAHEPEDIVYPRVCQKSTLEYILIYQYIIL